MKKTNYGASTGFVPPKMVEKEMPDYKIIPIPKDPTRMKPIKR